MGKIKEHFKPNFFIPGAAKSGTTSLHELLDTHPDISMSKEKEPVYWNNKLFNEFENLEISRYLNLFEQDVKIKGESTTSYMYYDNFIKNIRDNFNKSQIDFQIKCPNGNILYVDPTNQNGSGSVGEKIPHKVWKYYKLYDYKKVYILMGKYDIPTKNPSVVKHCQDVTDRYDGADGWTYEIMRGLYKLVEKHGIYINHEFADLKNQLPH